MRKNRLIRALRLLCLSAVILWGVGLSLAQTQAQKQKANLPPPNTHWVKDPAQVMPMRSMTNEQRRAAAQRQKVRRAAAGKNHNINKTPVVKP